MVENSLYSYDNYNLNQQGREVLFFKILEDMKLNGKIELIKEENGNTSKVQLNTDGTTKSNPC